MHTGVRQLYPMLCRYTVQLCPVQGRSRNNRKFREEHNIVYNNLCGAVRKTCSGRIPSTWNVCFCSELKYAYRLKCTVEIHLSYVNFLTTVGFVQCSTILGMRERRDWKNECHTLHCSCTLSCRCLPDCPARRIWFVYFRLISAAFKSINLFTMGFYITAVWTVIFYV